MLGIIDHLVFNSFSGLERFQQGGFERLRPLSCGLRLNPEHREVATALYDPCGPFSRLGVTRANFRPDLLEGIDGFHFHNLCELNADSLARTLAVVEAQFGSFFPGRRWINFGGGHHITRPDYQVDRLCELIVDFKKRHDLDVYLEPGEAVALNTGVLVTSVLDIVHNQCDIAILDTSAAAHMPDVLEMPYRPEIVGARPAGELPHTYRLGGLSCLAGDIIGDYAFAEPLKVGSRLVFLDMAHYTMVKNTTFNGIRLPSILICTKSGEIRLVRRFSYEDYRNRLS